MDQLKIGKFIALKRKEKNYTQEFLASKLGVTYKTISRWENGNYMPDLSNILMLSDILDVSIYELLLGEDKSTFYNDHNNIEVETRVLFDLDCEEKLLKKIREVDDLNYKGKFYEKTIQYNHPSSNIDFYSKEIDARFRVRITKNNNLKKCMISYKRRGNDYYDNLINKEEEVEVNVDYASCDNLIYILENVLLMDRVESYERYRYVFYNEYVEIDLDIYPFMIALEIENKSSLEDSFAIVIYYLEKLGFSTDDIYRFSWDDKYNELCKCQGIEILKDVLFGENMPIFDK